MNLVYFGLGGEGFDSHSFCEGFGDLVSTKVFSKVAYNVVTLPLLNSTRLEGYTLPGPY